MYDCALLSLVGGVNSPVRAVPQPIPAFIDHGEGAHLVDIDGDRYLDYTMGCGPLLLDHDLPDIVRSAIAEAVADGPIYGAPTRVEVDLAEFVIEHVASVETLRFVNSGTEAPAAGKHATSVRTESELGGNLLDELDFQFREDGRHLDAQHIIVDRRCD
jgi:glutamate-1-semialdehyde 2,1-aminomutase